MEVFTEGVPKAGEEDASQYMLDGKKKSKLILFEVQAIWNTFSFKYIFLIT